MPGIPIEVLPRDARVACERLQERLRGLLDTNLVALWAYGAATFPDRPNRLGDLDTHGIIASQPDRDTIEAIDKIHGTIADESGVEWDSWYILQSDATGVRPPEHAFRERLFDFAWALHRAHWLADQYVALAGCTPAELVRAPTWEEIEEALRSELLYIEQLIDEGSDDARHAAFAVWNGCRIMYSLDTRDVVVSKRSAARWALECMPRSWHAAVRAAGRVYDGEADPADILVLQTSMVPIVSAVRERID